MQDFFLSGFRIGVSPLQDLSPSPFATGEPSACTCSSGSGIAVFAGSLPPLELEPNRIFKCRQLWIRLMQRSFGSSPRGNDEAVCLVDTVESHVPEKDDGCKVDL